MIIGRELIRSLNDNGEIRETNFWPELQLSSAAINRSKIHFTCGSSKNKRYLVNLIILSSHTRIIS